MPNLCKFCATGVKYSNSSLVNSDLTKKSSLWVLNLKSSLVGSFFIQYGKIFSPRVRTLISPFFTSSTIYFAFSKSLKILSTSSISFITIFCILFLTVDFTCPFYFIFGAMLLLIYMQHYI